METPEETSRLSSDRAALVDPTCIWKPITAKTPVGTKLQLINREAGVAHYGTLTKADLQPGAFYTHYYELPVFAKEDGHA